MNIDSLSDDVARAIAELSEPFDDISRQFDAKERGFAYRIPPTEAELLGWFMTAAAGQGTLLQDIPQSLRWASSKARELLQTPRVKSRLCSALRSVSGDAFDIAKLITPVLVTLSYTKVISFALEPLAIAFMALVVARGGVSAFCDEGGTPSHRRPKRSR